MPHVVLTERAIRGMERCRRFLSAKSPSASRRAMEAVRTQYATLRHAPETGRPVGDGLRELIIPFGDSGYLAQYSYEPSEDTVYIVAFRHQREEDY